MCFGNLAVVTSVSERADASHSEYQSLLVAGSPFRISTCIIPKNMSIVLTNIFCYIYMNLVGRTNDTVTSMRADSCSFRNQFGYFKQISRIFHGDPWTHFVLVREPAERFLSGFTFVCDSESYYAKFCEDCVGDVKCALRTAFEYSQRRAVGDFNADSYLFWHLSPQNWRCELRDNLDNSKLVHYSSNKKDKLVNDIRELLSDANVHDSDIDVITSQIANGTTGHATNHLPQREEYSKQMQNDEFKRLLVKVYFWDYILFNFPLPDVEI
ncbi:hypothetical protein Q1695_007002 [Nippostrongylus brasiliensis]|nr:hypothetical protein Q1695_007002 [Nippostrongylus brasiliensis]